MDSLSNLEEESNSKNEASEDSVEFETFAKIQIKIIDTGIGIKKENLNKLFTDFGKLAEHSKMNSQGTGLGLSICKRMIE